MRWGNFDGGTAEQIEMHFGMLSRVGPGNHVLDGGADAPLRRNAFEGYLVDWKHCIAQHFGVG